MADRYLLHKPTQALYIWQSVYAGDPDFEEVAEEVPAEPEVVAEAEVVAKTTRKQRATAANAEATDV